eukprot:403345376
MSSNKKSKSHAQKNHQILKQSKDQGYQNQLSSSLSNENSAIYNDSKHDNGDKHKSKRRDKSHKKHHRSNKILDDDEEEVGGRLPDRRNKQVVESDEDFQANGNELDSYDDSELNSKSNLSSQSLTNETANHKQQQYQNHRGLAKALIKDSKLVGKKRGKPDKYNEYAKDNDDDDQLSDDEFLKRIDKNKLNKKNKEDKEEEELDDKKEKIDLDKLTKRQRMAYLQKQNPQPNKQQQIQIGRLNKQDQTAALAKYLDPNVEGDMVFYELANAKPNYNQRTYDEFDYDDDDELNPGLQPRNKLGRKPKNQADQKVYDEQKRVQLEKILEEQRKKFIDREKKLTNHMNSEVSNGNGVVGRYIFQNALRMQARICPIKPGEHNIKIKSVDKLIGQDCKHYSR